MVSKFETKFADSEQVVKTWNLSVFNYDGKVGTESVILTNKRFIYEKRGETFLEKTDIPVDTIQSIKTGFSFQKTMLVVLGILCIIFGVFAILFYAIPGLGNSIDSLSSFLVAFLIGGGFFILLGILLIIIGKLKIKHLLVSIEVTHNGGAITQIALPPLIKVENAKYNKQCFSMVNDLGYYLTQIKDGKIDFYQTDEELVNNLNEIKKD